MPEQREKYADLFKSDNFWFSRMLLIVIGQWPFVSPWITHLFRFLILGVLLNGTPFVFIAIHQIWQEDKKMVAPLMPPLLTVSISLTKFINFFGNRLPILSLISGMYNNWKIAVGEEQKILQVYFGYGKSTSYLYARVLYTTMVLFLLMPLTPAVADIIKPLNETRKKRLLFPVRYSETCGPEEHYTLITFHCASAVFAASTIIIASDVFIISLVTHACGLFAVAKHWLEHIYDGIPDLSIELHTFNVDNPSYDPELTQLCIKRVAYALTWHHKALNFSAMVQDTFSTSLLIILGINMLLISMTGFQILTQKDRFDGILIGATYIFGQMCHLYLLTLPGQMLVNESESIRDSITKTYSYDLPVKAQKMLILVLMRGLRSSKITAGKFFVLEMETFMSVLQASLSYFTVLANFS